MSGPARRRARLRLGLGLRRRGRAGSRPSWSRWPSAWRVALALTVVALVGCGAWTEGAGAARASVGVGVGSSLGVAVAAAAAAVGWVVATMPTASPAAPTAPRTAVPAVRTVTRVSRSSRWSRRPVPCGHEVSGRRGREGRSACRRIRSRRSWRPVRMWTGAPAWQVWWSWWTWPRWSWRPCVVRRGGRAGLVVVALVVRGGRHDRRARGGVGDGRVLVSVDDRRRGRRRSVAAGGEQGGRGREPVGQAGGGDDGDGAREHGRARGAGEQLVATLRGPGLGHVVLRSSYRAVRPDDLTVAGPDVRPVRRTCTPDENDPRNGQGVPPGEARGEVHGARRKRSDPNVTLQTKARHGPARAATRTCLFLG